MQIILWFQGNIHQKTPEDKKKQGHWSTAAGPKVGRPYLGRGLRVGAVFETRGTGFIHGV